jgi:hypothetical protein
MLLKSLVRLKLSNTSSYISKVFKIAKAFLLKATHLLKIRKIFRQNGVLLK